MIDQKTIERLEWITPPENQGQHVTESYATEEECVYKKITSPTGILYLCACMETIELHSEEEWFYEPWNEEPIVPDFLWHAVEHKEVTND